MGWLIRFIHNRDLAVENIAKAYVRRCFMLSAPTPTLRALRTAVAIGGVNLSYGTIVGGVSSSAPRGRSAPGEYAVDYVATARTSRVVDLLAPDAPAGSPQATLRPLMRGLARRHDLGEPHLCSVLHMQSAVRLLMAGPTGQTITSSTCGLFRGISTPAPWTMSTRVLGVWLHCS